MAQNIRRVRRVSVVDEIVEQLTESIISGEWPPGTVLPSLRTFAASSGVSMLTVREALRILQARGLVETRHGVGTFVRSPEERDEGVPWLLGVDDADEYLEFVEAREVIETQLLTFAAARRTPEQVDQLRAIVDEMAAAREDGARFLEADVQFHTVVAEAAHNRILLRCMLAIRGPLKRLIANRTMQHLEEVGHLDGPVVDHREVLEAIEQGSAPAGQPGLDRIIERARDYLDSLRTAPSGSETAGDLDTRSFKQ